MFLLTQHKDHAMTTYTVTLTIKLNDDAVHPDWIVPAIEDNLLIGEKLVDYAIEVANVVTE